jgi:glycosyltransferase involved in cell wall biosynthesis
MEDLVTVLVTVYNNEKFLEETLESVLNFNYQNLDILIVDNASTDRSPSIISSYARKDSRIRVIRHPENRGHHESLKTGLENAYSEFVFNANADDINLPDRIEKCMKIFREDKNVGMIVANALIIDENSHETGQLYRFTSTISEENLALKQFTRNNCCLGATMAVRYHKGMIDKILDSTYFDDYQLCLEYLLNGNDIKLLHEVVIKYRLHSNNYSNNQQELIRRTIYMLKQYDTERVCKELFRRGFPAADIYFTLGLFELFRDNLLGAKTFLLQAQNGGKGKEFETLFYLGVVYSLLDQPEESLNYFQQAYKINMDEPTVLNNLGILLVKVNDDLEKSIKMIEKSLLIKQDFRDAKDNLFILENLNRSAAHYEEINKLKITTRILNTASREIVKIK